MSASPNHEQRVVLTGIGIVSPIGIGVDACWESLRTGRSGVGTAELLPQKAAPDDVVAEVKDFTDSTAKKQYLTALKKSIKVMCREIQMGVASASLALENSGLNLGEIDHQRFGIDFGANLMLSPPDQLKDAAATCLVEDNERQQFSYEKWGGSGLASMEPLWLLKYLPNMPACHIGIFADARGPNNSITLEEASGNAALSEAYRVILRGQADIMIAGCTGTRVHPIKTMHAALWDQLATTPPEAEKRSRPFELNRSGQVVGEGACSFILEKEELARARGATIYGTILGCGASCVVNKQGQADTQRALVNAMRAALSSAGLQPQDVGHINAHGLGTKADDVREARAILEVFGETAPQVPVTAIKSYFGNTGSACGTLELAASLVALRHGVIPHTLNYDTPDPECPLNIVHGEPLTTDNGIVLKINVTRMGQATAVLVAAPMA